jgi:hypothetical protein
MTGIVILMLIFLGKNVEKFLEVGCGGGIKWRDGYVTLENGIGVIGINEGFLGEKTLVELHGFFGLFGRGRGALVGLTVFGWREDGDEGLRGLLGGGGFSLGGRGGLRFLLF